MKGLLTPIAAATLFALVGCGADKTSEEYLTNAKQYLSSGSEDAAVIELKNAIRESSENVEARLILGDIYYGQGAYEAAEKEYLYALKAGADANSAAPKLALTYYKSNKSKEIVDLAQEYSRLNAEASATMAAVQALSYLAEGDMAQAKDYLAIAEQKQADNIYTLLSQATINVSSQEAGDPQERLKLAVTTVQEVLAIAPDNVEANLIYAHLLMSQKKYPEAEQRFEKIRNLSPMAPQYELYLAQSLIKQDKFEQAEPHINNLLTVAPEHPTINEYKAQVLYARQDFKGAKAHSEKALQNGSTSMTSYVMAGISSMKVNQLEQAYLHLSKVQSSLPNDHMISRIYAYLQLQLGYVDEATATLDRLTNLKESDAALFASATAELAKSGQDTKALDYAEKAAKLDETGANTVKLGILKLANQNQEGLDDLERALSTNPDLVEARLALVYSLLNQGEEQPARKAADDMLKAFPDDPRGYTLKGLVEKRLGNLEQALTLFDQALAKSSNDPITLIGKADVLTQLKQEPAAFGLHKQNIMHNADKPYVVRSFMAHAGKFNHDKEATEWVKQLYEANKSNAFLSWAYAVGLAANSQQEQAIGILEGIAEHQPITFQLLGDLYIQSRQFVKAEDIYSQWLAVQPNNPQIYQRLIAASELQHDYSDALRYSQQARQHFPKSQVFALLEATMLFEKGQVRAARIAADNLNEDTAAHPVAIRLQARIAMHEKEYPRGLVLWQDYYKKQPDMNGLVALAKAYQWAGKPTEAIAILEQEMGQYDIQYPAHMSLGALYLETDPIKALAHFQAVLKESPENVVALNNSAWLLAEQGQLQNALVIAQKAYELSNQNPAVSDTYGSILLKTGDSKQALSVLEQAYQAMRNNPEIALHYAEALLAEGRKTQAKQVLAVTKPESASLKELKARLLKQL